ncbi:MAG: hypothetical protein U1A06_10360 [Hoeflea sp.]|nr:hypothetical protein [Hoeflea sp.]
MLAAEYWRSALACLLALFGFTPSHERCGETAERRHPRQCRDKQQKAVTATANFLQDLRESGSSEHGGVKKRRSEEAETFSSLPDESSVAAQRRHSFVENVKFSEISEAGGPDSGPDLTSRA